MDRVLAAPHCPDRRGDLRLRGPRPVVRRIPAVGNRDLHSLPPGGAAKAVQPRTGDRTEEPRDDDLDDRSLLYADDPTDPRRGATDPRSEEHTSELQSLR